MLQCLLIVPVSPVWGMITCLRSVHKKTLVLFSVRFSCWKQNAWTDQKWLKKLLLARRVFYLTLPSPKLAFLEMPAHSNRHKAFSCRLSSIQSVTTYIGDQCICRLAVTEPSLRVIAALECVWRMSPSLLCEHAVHSVLTHSVCHVVLMLLRHHILYKQCLAAL